MQENIKVYIANTSGAYLLFNHSCCYKKVRKPLFAWFNIKQLKFNSTTAVHDK